jgi:hypothetical protein
MLKEVLNKAASTLPISTMALAGVTFGAFAGRKLCCAAGCKIGGKVASLLGRESAVEWDQASDKYWTLAKKHAFRDLTAGAGIVMLGLASGYAVESALKEPKKELSLFENYGMPVFSTLWEYKSFITLSLMFIRLQQNWCDTHSQIYMEMASKDRNLGTIDGYLQKVNPISVLTSLK